MGISVTNGYDIVFELAEPALTRQLAALPELQQTLRADFDEPPLSGRARIRLSRPSAEFKSPGFVSERITIKVDIAGSALTLTQPQQGLIPLEGTLELAGRVRVQQVAGSGTPGSRVVVLDFTTNNGGPDVLEVTFPQNTAAMDAGLQSIGITPNGPVRDLVRTMIRNEAREWMVANLRAVPLGPPMAISAAPAGPFAVTQLDAHVIEDAAGPAIDALAIALATCGGANPGLDPERFTSSAVPAGDDAAVMVSNSTLLSCVICPALATGLGIPVGSFTAPCSLAAPVAITVPGAPPVSITSLTATVSPGGLIAIRGTIFGSTAAWTLTGTFGVDIALTLPATSPPGGPAIVPVVTVLPSTASLTLAWWVWVAAAVLLPPLIGVVTTIVLLVAAAIVNGIANSAIATAITTGVAGALPAPAAIPLGPLAASFTPRRLTLDDLTLTGSVAVAAAPDQRPRLMVVDSLGEPIDAVQLTPQYAGSNTSWSLYVHNRGTTPLTLHSITKVDDPANALTIPDMPLPRTFAAGQTQALPCRYHPSQARRYLSVITLVSNDPFGPATADVEAEAVALPPHGRLDVKPKPLDFGKVIAKASTFQNLALDNVGNAPLNVTNVALVAELPADWFALPWSWPSNIPAGQSRTLPITLQPPQVGSASAALTIDIESAGGLYTEQHLISLAGVAGAPVIRLTPAPLDFGALAPGTSVTQQFTIRNDGDMDLIVEGISRTMGQADFLPDPSLTFPLTIPAGGQQAVGVTTTAAPWAGYVNSNEFEVHSNDPDTPGARIVCRCATAGSRILVQPDFVELARPPAVPARATVTISNRGSTQLDVGSVKGSGPPFSLVGLPPGPFPVAAGGQQQFEVEFNPSQAGDFIGQLEVRSSDVLRPRVSVGLHAAW